MNKLNLVSGTRPTGKLHLGHYFGVLRNWQELQDSDKYNCFFFIADWHSLTTKYSDTNDLQSNIVELTRDFLACGLNPNKSTIYVQSAIKQISELHLLLSMITPNNWAERDPTLKDLVRAANNSQTNSPDLTYGMLGYPILQSADILTFQGSLVPIGKDQEAHLELSREIARRFNYIFGIEFFPEPKPLFTTTPLVPGIDGDKMSKSYNNDIKIAASGDDTFAEVKKMVTDAERAKRQDPGNTERCKVPYPYYKILAEAEVLEQVKQECESALRGCVDCKKQLAGIMNDFFKPIREKRNSFSDQEIKNILKEGNEKAIEKAEQTLKEVRNIIKI
ncbi:MAG: tryptophan--tRNA ligase [Candidatus Melainabacteria bacterium]|jgi:tryptophanyl-tRNA synthetase